MARILWALFVLLTASVWAGDTILNVSYDPTREFYSDYNQLFAKHWKQKTGQDIQINQSHAGSGAQARSVIAGLEADVVSLALAYDIDLIAKKSHLLPENWQSRLPNDSSPFTSTVVFMVRKGNPKQIKDWDDLIRPDVAVITPNPRTSGGARWNYVAAYAYAMKKFNGDEQKARDFLQKIYQRVAVLDTGARGSTATFARRGIGDVWVGWEDEAFLTLEKEKPGEFEIVAPSISVLAQPPVTVVDKVVDDHGTRELAQEYLQFLYSPEAQELAVRHHFRPVSSTVSEKHADKYPKMTLVNIKDFGGWKEFQQKHFDEGAIYDQISMHP